MRRMLLRCALAGVIVQAWFLPPRCSGQTPRIVLDAQLPAALAGCVSTERLQASYERALGRVRGSEPRAVELRVSLRSLAQTDVTRLELRAATEARVLGERSLPVRPDDCEALPDTLALVLLLLSQSAEPEPAPAALQLTAAEPMLDSEVPGRVRPTPPPPAGPVIGLGIGAAGTFGALARAALELQLVAVLRTAALDWRVRAALLWPEELAIAEGRVTMRSYEVALEACPRWTLSQGFEVRVCVGPRFGLVHAVSRGFAVQNTSASEFLLCASATPEAAVALTRSTWLALSAGLGVVLQRPRFVLEFAEPKPAVELAGPALVRAELGVALMQMF